MEDPDPPATTTTGSWWPPLTAEDGPDVALWEAPAQGGDGGHKADVARVAAPIAGKTCKSMEPLEVPQPVTATTPPPPGEGYRSKKNAR